MDKIDSSLPVLHILQEANVVDGDKVVILASDWTISAIGSRMERQVLSHWESQFVVWTQFLELAEGDNQYETSMNFGKYCLDYESGLKCFQKHIKKHDIKLYDCVEVNVNYRTNTLEID